MKFFYLWISLFAYSLAFGQTKDIKTEIGNLLKQQKLTGAVWTLVSNDSIKCYGVGTKNLETGESISKDDLVHVGSITKTVLALGVLRLATENKLNIDEPIKKYLPNLPLNNPWESSTPVTIRNLLDHTSGLSDLRLWHFFSSTSTPNTPLSQFYSNNSEVLKISAQPGTVFSYSNTGYTLLGMLIQAVVKEPYEIYLDRNLLHPIGLKNSTFKFVSQVGNNANQRLVMGHFDTGEIAPAMPIYLRPAGQFTTSAFDMGVLLKFILNEGRLNDSEFIRKEFIRNLGVPTTTIAAKNNLKNGYALGAASRDRHNVIGIAHSGNIIGFHAMYYFFPNEKKAFFISHNMDSESADYEVFNKALIDFLGIPQKTTQHTTRNSSNDKTDKWNGFYVPLITKVEPTELFDIISSYVQVENTEKGLLFKPFQKNVITLTSINDRLYIAKNKADASHLFYENESGERYVTTGIQTVKKMNGWKISFLTLSVLFGLLSCILIFPVGLYQIFKKGKHVYKEPVIYTFTALLVILIAGILISTNGIIHIGNKNFSTFLLYLSTILFPLFGLISLIMYVKNIKDNIKKFGFWLMVLTGQFVVLLLSYGLIPFVTWE